MWFLTILTYISIFVQLCFITISLAAALYYLAELVEEYTVVTRKIIILITWFTLIVYVFLWLCEGFPNLLVICGVLSHLNHFAILQDFPYVKFLSPTLLTAIVFIAINHYLAFNYFDNAYHSFSEAMAYFTLCLWIVPLALFISLSANDNVLPTNVSREGDLVSAYFLKKERKGLLSLFNYAKQSLLPTQRKKGY